MVSASKERVYEVGDVRVDVSAAQVRKSGRTLQLEPKAFQTLLYLIERPGQLVEKQTLLDAVWGDVFVTENALARVIAQLRKALDDDAKQATYIETVPTMGYRFVAPVQETSRPKGKYWAVLGAGTVAALATAVALMAPDVEPPRIDSLAVLPLENLSAIPEQEFFTDGMTVAVIARLAQINGLKVISSASVLTYKDQPRKPLPQIARELDVDAVIEGSVLRAGDRVRITVQLIDAASDRHLWADSYEGDLVDVLALQADVAQAIAREIEVELTPQQDALLIRSQRVDPEAHDDYLKGKLLLSGFELDRYERAIDLFDRAIARAPDFALAYSAKAFAYYWLGVVGDLPPLDAVANARAFSTKALELDPMLDDALVTVGMLELATWNWTEAERALEHAIQLNPSSSRAHEAYAWFLSAMGRHEEAIDRARQAVQLNPLDLGARTLVARFHFYARDYDRAIEEARSVLEIDPDFVAAYTVIEWAQVQQGAYDSAVSTKREELERMGLNPKELASLDKAYQDGGVERYWQWKLELILDKAYYRSSVNEVIAGHYVRMGEFDRGFEHLLKAYEERELFLFLLNVNPWWDPVRDDLRFQDIISRLNYPPA